MPPPKRPKSDVHWSTLSGEVEICHMPERQNCYNGYVNSEFSSVNEEHLSSAMTPSTSSPAVCPLRSLPVVAGHCPATTDDRRYTGGVSPPGSPHPQTTRLSSLRRLLLEPMTPSSDLYRTPTISSSPASVVVGTPTERWTASARVMQRASPSPTDLSVAPVYLQSAAAADTQRNLPTHLLLDDNADDSCKHLESSGTRSVDESCDSAVLLRQKHFTCIGHDRSFDPAASAVARSLPQHESTSPSADSEHPMDTLSLSSRYVQLSSLLEPRESKCDKHRRREPDESLK